MSLGRNLNALLYDRGITAKELAKRTGVSEAAISRIRANGRNPSIGLAKKLADAFGITLDALLK